MCFNMHLVYNIPMDARFVAECVPIMELLDFYTFLQLHAIFLFYVYRYVGHSRHNIRKFQNDSCTSSECF